MNINTLEQLRALRTKIEKESDNSKVTRLLFGMGTCGIAAGAKDTMEEIQTIIDKNNIKDVELIGVGCVGFCCMEPTIEVYRPNEKPLLYGNMKKNMAQEIVDKIIVQKSFLDESLLIETFKKVSV